MEAGVAEGEDAAVGCRQPVPLAIGGGRHPHDRAGERHRTGGAMEAGVAEGEDAAVGGHQPVPLAIGGGRHPHDRASERHRTGGAMEAGVAEGEDAAVCCHQPVAASVGRGRHPHDRAVERHRTGGAVEPGVAKGEDAAVGGRQPVTRKTLGAVGRCGQFGLEGGGHRRSPSTGQVIARRRLVMHAGNREQVVVSRGHIVERGRAACIQGGVHETHG